MQRGAMLALAALVLVTCKGRPRSGPVAPGSGATGSEGDGTVVELDLEQGAPESADSGSLFLPMPASRTYAGLVRAIASAKKNTDATAYYVRFGDASFGWARSEELGRLLGDLRKTGKPVVCHTHSLENSSAWLAGVGCDRIWISPAGDVDAVGIASQMVYLKGALDRLKIHADFVHMGKYKSASEPLTREGPSDEAREAMQAMLGSMRTAWLDGVTSGRKAAGIREAMEHGPWSAQEAKQHGLVDDVGYASEALADAKKRGKAGKVEVGFGPKARGGGGLDIAELIRVISGADERTGGRPHIAIVVGEGEITMEGGGLLSSGGISEKAIDKTLRRLTKDDSVKAVVLRIDSPGGSALASDLIWHELSELRDKKPLVVSVGDMAASGGYYMACAASRILAEKTSIVGSIGVLGGKIAIAPALAEVGVNSVTFAASPEPGAAERAAYLSALTPWDDATRDRVKAEMSDVYELFVSRVAKGRKMSVDAVKKIAEGRVWSGAQGKDIGLVDEFGGLDRAITIARDLAKLDADAPVTVEGGGESLLEQLMVGDNASSAEIENAVRRLEAAPQPLTLLLTPELRPFAASLAPLLGREHVLAAMPYAIVVR